MGSDRKRGTLRGAAGDAAILRHSEFLLPFGEKVRMRGSPLVTVAQAAAILANAVS
jgi:hypothetical protein